MIYLKRQKLILLASVAEVNKAMQPDSARLTLLFAGSTKKRQSATQLMAALGLHKNRDYGFS